MEMPCARIQIDHESVVVAVTAAAAAAAAVVSGEPEDKYVL